MILDSLFTEVNRTLKGDSVFFAIRSDGERGTGTRENPYRGNSPDDLDEVLADIPPSVVLCLGPGLFRTRGDRRWSAKSGQSIIGSGISSTTLRLIIDSSANADPVTAIAGVLGVNQLFVSDLTIDCYMRGQAPHTTFPLFARVTPGAIGASGKKIVVRRVRIIDFGTKWKDMEGFPIYLQGPDTEDSLIGL